MGYTDLRNRSGFARIGPTAAQCAKRLKDFHGESGLTKSQLLSAFKRVTSELKIDNTAERLVDLMFAFSRDQDWEPGRQPIVWPSNSFLAEELGLSVRQTQRSINKLVDLGVIVRVDSPTGQRYGLRCEKTGHIIYAYGFDLTPIAQRHEEFLTIFHTKKRRAEERSQLKRSITVERKKIRQLAEIGIELSRDQSKWEELLYHVETIMKPTLKPNDIAGYRKRAAALLRLRLDTESTINDLLTDHHHNQTEKEMSCTHDIEDVPIQSTTHQPFDKSNTCNSDWQESRSDPAQPTSFTPNQCAKHNQASDDLAHYRVTPAMIAAAIPEFGLKDTPRPDWRDIIDRGTLIRPMLGISEHAWSIACRDLGRETAAVAIAVLCGRRQEIQKPGGWFRGVIAKAQTGELHLGKSVHALRKRNEDINCHHTKKGKYILDSRSGIG